MATDKSIDLARKQIGSSNGGSLGLTAADDEMASNRYSGLPSKVRKIANLSFQPLTPTESGCLDLPACLQHTAADCNNRISA